MQVTTAVVRGSSPLATTSCASGSSEREALTTTQSAYPRTVDERIPHARDLVEAGGKAGGLLEAVGLDPETFDPGLFGLVYAEVIHRLAAGIEPWDPVRRQRHRATITVTADSIGDPPGRAGQQQFGPTLCAPVGRCSARPHPDTQRSAVALKVAG